MKRFTRPPSRMSKAEFIEAFGGIYEHSDWVAEKAWKCGITAEQDLVENMAALLARVVDGSDKETKLALIRSHPDLAGKAAVAGELTEASSNEQAGAGLADCTAEEFEMFQAYNDTYKRKFGFPYIQAVKNSNRYEILDGFRRRLENTADQEFETALGEIDKIALFRLMEL